MDYLPYIDIIPDFPLPGVLFFDFTTLHVNPLVFDRAVSDLIAALSPLTFDAVVAVEAKGFILGTRLAAALSLPLYLARKPGLTPGLVISEDFEKEYGRATYEMKAHALAPATRVLIVYDILAGPGATNAVARLIQAQNAIPVAAAFVIELEYLPARALLIPERIVSLVKIPSPEPFRDPHHFDPPAPAKSQEINPASTSPSTSASTSPATSDPTSPTTSGPTSPTTSAPTPPHSTYPYP